MDEITLNTGSIFARDVGNFIINIPLISNLNLSTIIALDAVAVHHLNSFQNLSLLVPSNNENYTLFSSFVVAEFECASNMTVSILVNNYEALSQEIGLSVKMNDIHANISSIIGLLSFLFNLSFYFILFF